MICAGLVVGNDIALKEDTFVRENFPTKNACIDIMEFFHTAVSGVRSFAAYCEAIYNGIASTCRFNATTLSDLCTNPLKFRQRECNPYKKPSRINDHFGLFDCDECHEANRIQKVNFPRYHEYCILHVTASHLYDASC